MISAIAPVTIDTPRVSARAACSCASISRSSWAGNSRGGGGSTRTGGRQPGGGGDILGGPVYAGGAGALGIGGLAGSPPGGRRQISSPPVLVVTEPTVPSPRSAVRYSAEVPYPETGYSGDSPDDRREVAIAYDELVILPDTTRDDTDAGWGERGPDNDRRLLEDRPPHWD
jgi:hypothetical protein